MFSCNNCCVFIYIQLQHLVSDDVCIQAQELYLAEKKKGGCGGPLSTASQRVVYESSYQRAAEQQMQDENCFRFVIVSQSSRDVFAPCRGSLCLQYKTSLNLRVYSNDGPKLACL